MEYIFQKCYAALCRRCRRVVQSGDCWIRIFFQTSVNLVLVLLAKRTSLGKKSNSQDWAGRRSGGSCLRYPLLGGAGCLINLSEYRPPGGGNGGIIRQLLRALHTSLHTAHFTLHTSHCTLHTSRALHATAHPQLDS